MDTTRLVDQLIIERDKAIEARNNLQAEVKRLGKEGYSKDIGYQFKVLDLTRFAERLNMYDKVIGMVHWDDWGLDVKSSEVKDTTVDITISMMDFWKYLDYLKENIDLVKQSLECATREGNRQRIDKYQRELYNWEERYNRLVNNKNIHLPNTKE